MFQSATLAALSLGAGVYAQQIGTLTAETHPKLSTSKCTASGCTTQQQTVVLDANWRWLHSTSGATNCYTGNTWDASLCPDATTCASNCALDGADYSGTYGIQSSGNALTLKLVTGSGSTANVGSRVYLMDTADKGYQEFNLLNQEFAVDVDVSNLPCGLNGALYFVSMDADGGQAKNPTNKAGAKYGTGYCDSQCPQDLKFINGKANNVGWTPSSNSANSGTGKTGACCSEMDIWEANSISAAYTPHPCDPIDLEACTSDTTCGVGDDRYSGICDKDGCDFNSYRMGNTSFYGPGKIVDTKSKFTLVTQFITSDNTATGDLVEIRRLYVQNGKVIQNSVSNVAGISGNSITEDFCTAQKSVFGDTNSFANKGGLKAMGEAFKAGMVLVLSIWDDYAVNMLWLDAPYPTDAPITNPGVARGTCATDSGKPADVEKNTPGASVTFSNIKTGPIGSTYSGSSTGGGAAPAPPVSSSTKASTPATSATKPATSSTKATTPTPPAANCAAKWGQCGGQGWTGPTCCASGSTCKSSNQYYSQCL